MSYLSIIHRIRQIKGMARQPRYATDLLNLHSVITGNSLKHPYRINHKVDPFLLTVPAFALGGRGDPAKAPNDGFLYHLTSIRKVIDYTDWTYFPSNFPTKMHEDRRAFECVIKEHKRKSSRWLSLSDYAQGELWGFRGFTWWTSHDLQPVGILCEAHKLGMPNGWIPKYALILRCSAKFAHRRQLVRIPTTLDGFCSEIFCPAEWKSASSPPLSGFTIDLCGSGSLKAGVDEYALRPVEVNEIDFYPILIDRSIRSKHSVQRDGRLWQLLEIYYNLL